MSQSKPEVWLDCPRCGVELCRILEHHFDLPGLTWSCPRCGALAHLCVETRGDQQVAYLATDEELRWASLRTPGALERRDDQKGVVVDLNAYRKRSVER